MKGLGICISLVEIGVFTAHFTIISYSVIIFQKAESSIDPHLSSILLAIILITGSLLTTFLADVLGRKLLIIISVFGSAVGLFSLALYQYLSLIGFDLTSFELVPVISISFVIFMSAVGIMPLALVSSVEHLRPKVYISG